MRIRGLEGLGGLGLGCEWLAGLVWEGLGCVGFVYKIVEIMAASSNNGGGRVLGLLCMGRNGAGSNLVEHFDFFPFFQGDHTLSRKKKLSGNLHIVELDA